MILAGDIGGTHTRLAFFQGDAQRPLPLALEVFPSKMYGGPEEILQEFLARHPFPVESAAFGIAGAVRNGRCQTPNLPWVVDSVSLAQFLGLASTALLNDLEANAHGIAVLGPGELIALSEGAPGSTGNCVLIAAGTGLGEAGLIVHGGQFQPYPSEGGHADFAPRNETEIDLLRYLLDRFEHVSYERVLSGPGLYNIYQFFRDTNRAGEPAWLAAEMKEGDPAAVISHRALEGGAPICEMTMDQFVSIFGAEAGNLALKGMATGGVYLGGGIAPKILPKLQGPGFLQAFSAKGRLASLLEAIPVHVILNEQAALLGAARVAFLASPQQGRMGDIK